MFRVLVAWQVADLERLLSTANQRCVALEARLGLLERELVEAEGGEVFIGLTCVGVGVRSAYEPVTHCSRCCLVAAAAADRPYAVGTVPPCPDWETDRDHFSWSQARKPEPHVSGFRLYLKYGGEDRGILYCMSCVVSSFFFVILYGKETTM